MNSRWFTAGMSATGGPTVIPGTDTDLARVAWEGPHAAPHIHPTRLRVFHAVWDNPRPDEEIVSFDFDSTMTATAAPFLIAVTVE